MTNDEIFEEPNVQMTMTKKYDDFLEKKKEEEEEAMERVKAEVNEHLDSQLEIPIEPQAPEPPPKKPRKKRVMTEEQKEVLRERLKKAREASLEKRRANSMIKKDNRIKADKESDDIIKKRVKNIKVDEYGEIKETSYQQKKRIDDLESQMRAFMLAQHEKEKAKEKRAREKAKLMIPTPVKKVESKKEVVVVKKEEPKKEEPKPVEEIKEEPSYSVYSKMPWG